MRNSPIINNLTVNIVENSYDKDYILMDEDIYDELKIAKKENNEIIYRNEKIDKSYNENIRPMFSEVYYKLLDDAKHMNKNSVLYKHHIKFIEDSRYSYFPEKKYIEEEPNQIVVDYIASMTDDYFIDLYNYLFPDGKYKIEFISYFDNL
ncbi:Phosphohydrolase-associated domain-containing protein [Sporobacter termitidis DSM 10068]|uniref:Phosphohydrolase-associated domain-containing protein n=1 Tax=Sporobacter termitidis DSM 10068 TaxID=1123282 RepID=A0A1M5U3T8_9FIRM|nr:hypothetical protein [Sporobacter termitidis]SHH57353.1 Phosphohydrolase-associated domain-containing protein [Sporobacter termitidis DSM 10068]